MMVGRLPEAQAELERALELSPAGVNTTASIADVLFLQGRADEALNVISRMPEGYLRDERFALAHFARGDEREGDAMLARLLALAEKPDSDPEVALAVAEVYAAKNDPDRAFKWLDTARRRSKASLGSCQVWCWTTLCTSRRFSSRCMRTRVGANCGQRPRISPAGRAMRRFNTLAAPLLAFVGACSHPDQVPVAELDAFAERFLVSVRDDTSLHLMYLSAADAQRRCSLLRPFLAKP